MVPLLLIHRLMDMHLSHESILLVLLGLYFFIRYGVSRMLARITVHRGMFHSVPAMLIAGLVVYIAYGSPDRTLRGLLAGGVMLGFLSHLVLDEIYSVDFNGLRVKLKSSAGSAVKFFSPSVWGTIACYAILGILLSAAWLDWKQGGEEALAESSRGESGLEKRLDREKIRLVARTTVGLPSTRLLFQFPN